MVIFYGYLSLPEDTYIDTIIRTYIYIFGKTNKLAQKEAWVQPDSHSFGVGITYFQGPGQGHGQVCLQGIRLFWCSWILFIQSYRNIPTRKREQWLAGKSPIFFYRRYIFMVLFFHCHLNFPGCVSRLQICPPYILGNKAMDVTYNLNNGFQALVRGQIYNSVYPTTNCFHHIKSPRWWFQMFYMFIPTWGNSLQFDLRVFVQMVWFNHQIYKPIKQIYKPKSTNQQTLFTT